MKVRNAVFLPQSLWRLVFIIVSFLPAPPEVSACSITVKQPLSVDPDEFVLKGEIVAVVGPIKYSEGSEETYGWLVRPLETVNVPQSAKGPIEYYPFGRFSSDCQRIGFTKAQLLEKFPLRSRIFVIGRPDEKLRTRSDKIRLASNPFSTEISDEAAYDLRKELVRYSKALNEKEREELFWKVALNPQYHSYSYGPPFRHLEYDEHWCRQLADQRPDEPEREKLRSYCSSIKDGVLPKSIAESLRAENKWMRAFAAYVAGKKKDTSDEVTVLLKQLLEQDDHGDVRQNSAWALYEIGSEASLAALKDFALHPDDAAKSDRLRDSLRTGDESSQVAAMSAVEYEGPALRGALSALRKALHSPSPRIRAMAVVLVGRIGPAAIGSIPKLIRMLFKEGVDSPIPYKIVGVIAQIKPVPPSTIDALIKAQELNDSAVVFEATKALKEINTPQTRAHIVPGLVKALKAGPKLGLGYSEIISEFVATDRQAAIQALIAIIAAKHPSATEPAIEALATLGAAEAIPVLTELKDSTSQYAEAAKRALNQIQQQNSSSEPSSAT